MGWHDLQNNVLNQWRRSWC